MVTNLSTDFVLMVHPTVLCTVEAIHIQNHCLWHKEHFIHYSMKMLIFSHPIYYPDIRGSTIRDLSILMRNMFPCRIPISQ